MYRSGRLRGSKIMIVDDEITTINVVRRHLQTVGYCDFVTTTDPKRALGMIRRESPEILILDVMMGAYNGLDILESIRGDKHMADLPVIILTGASDSETRKEATALGATDFLAKPVDPNELALRVRNVLSIKARQVRITESSQRFALRYVVRAGREIPVKVTVECGEAREVCDGRLHDLATGGARLQVPREIAVAQQLEIGIILEDVNFSVSAAATTRWIQAADETWEVGCEFAADLPEHVFETMADAGYLERRSEHRRQISLDALLRQDRATDREVNVLLEDFSPGGIRLFSPQPVVVGERLLLYVRGANQELISIPGRAMWQIETDDGYTTGCAFLSKSGYAGLSQVVDSTLAATSLAAVLKGRSALTPILWLGTLGILLWCLTELGFLAWSLPF